MCSAWICWAKGQSMSWKHRKDLTDRQIFRIACNWSEVKEIAESGLRLLHKHEVLSSIPSIHRKSQWVRWHMDGWRQDPWGFCQWDNTAYLATLQVPMEDPVSKNRVGSSWEQHLRLSSGSHMHVHICVCTHPQSNTQMCAGKEEHMNCELLEFSI